ncbi:MAG: hypothetical protein KC933_19460 [Myxococcales bacterium]|nr:hypothetical protein [Myxococcales bacterium]
MRHKLTHRLFATLFPALLATACGGPTDPESLGTDNALEQDYAGLDEADEAPMFGDASFALLDEAAEDAAADPSEVGTTPTDPALARDFAHLSVTLLWGKLRPDPRETDVTDWSGVLHVDGGAIAAVRPIRFEAQDALRRGDDRSTLGWVSHTRPHHDGVHVLIRVPLTPEARTGSLNLRTVAYSVQIPLGQLTHLERVVDVGDNQVAINAFLVRPDDCPTGVLRGHWSAPNDRGVGRILGRWMSTDGGVQGHLRGLYGTRANGEQVFFAKVIAADGRFIGRLAGHFEAGEFEGRWITRGGEHHGGVIGRYRPAEDGEGGAFLGRWAERCGETTMPPERTPPPETRPTTRS